MTFVSNVLVITVPLSRAYKYTPRLTTLRIVLRCSVTGTGGGRLKAIAFRAMDSDLGPALLRRGALPLHLAGKLQWDRWAGAEAVQMIIDDAAPLNS